MKTVLSKALSVRASKHFAETLKAELEALPAERLPLQACTTAGGFVAAAPFTVCVLGSEADDTAITARLAVFFTEVVVNCGCGDDPYEQQVACNLAVRIDLCSGETTFSSLDG